MIKAAIEKILEIQKNEIHEINGKFYSEKSLELVRERPDRPRSINLSSLDSLIQMVKREIDAFPVCPIFIRVSSAKSVSAYTTYDSEYVRSELFEVKADAPDFNFGWQEYESAMIALRSQFKQDEEIAYILDLLKRVTDEESVATSDNGLTQTVEVKKGVSLKAKENVRPHVKLQPYRTFLEVEQPASEFLLRLSDGGKVGLFEADGGMWKLEARRTIAAYLKDELKELINAGGVVVTI